MTLQRLFYTSRIIDDDVVRGPTIARRIAEASARRNAECGVTGALAYIDGHFIQVLEGEMRSLEETFERICNDFRHREMKLIDYQTVPARLFPHWQMACLTDQEDGLDGRGGSLSEIRLLSTLNVREALTAMLRLVDEADAQALAA
jgi:hypothetical protein